MHRFCNGFPRQVLPDVHPSSATLAASARREIQS